MEQIFNQLEINSKLEEKILALANSSTSRASSSTAAAVRLQDVKEELEDQTDNVIEIEDSSDEEAVDGTAHTSNEVTRGATARIVASVGILNANTVGNSGRLEQSKESPTSTKTVNNRNEFRIGSTIIRGHRSITTNGTATSDGEATVAPDIDTSDGFSQQSNTLDMNSGQKSNEIQYRPKVWK